MTSNKNETELWFTGKEPLFLEQVFNVYDIVYLYHSPSPYESFYCYEKVAMVTKKKTLLTNMAVDQ